MKSLSLLGCAPLVEQAAQRIADGDAPRRSRRSQSFATLSNAVAVSFRCQVITTGRTRQAESSLGISPPRMARQSSPQRGFGMSGKTAQTGERLKSCTMIITEPNDFAAEIHYRMPVFLTEQQLGPWLSGEAGAEYLKPVANDYLQRWPVSKRVNSSKVDADDATLTEQVALKAA